MKLISKKGNKMPSDGIICVRGKNLRAEILYYSMDVNILLSKIITPNPFISTNH